MGRQNVDSLKDAEKALVNKDIFRNGSPKKGRLVPDPPKRLVVRDDPGPQRPTTAKRRENRPSSAERNRDDAMKPSVWLGGISRDSKAGQRSFIECTPAGSERPSSADRNRKTDPAGKKKRNKQRQGSSQGRPSSAERNRGDKVNNKVWLEGELNHDGTGEEGMNGHERPSSAGRRRGKRELLDNNGQRVDQNGRPSSAEKVRPGLAPLKGTPVKPCKIGQAAEI